MSQPVPVLVLGASGYVGQFIANRLWQLERNPTDASRFHIYASYASHPIHEDVIPNNRTCKVDVLSVESIDACFAAIKPDVIINTIAVSDILTNERDPAKAERINVPERWLQLLAEQRARGRRVLFVHLSTDQVFDGQHAPYSEDAVPSPLHTYGRTKLQAERRIAELLPDCHAVLRITAVLGPVGRVAGAHVTAVQQLAEGLRAGREVRAFADETRAFVGVRSVVAACERLLLAALAGRLPLPQLLHLCGPEPVTRLQLAQAVAARVLPPADAARLVLAGSRTEAPYPRPADLTMRTDRVRSVLGIQLDSLQQQLDHAFAPHSFL